MKVKLNIKWYDIFFSILFSFYIIFAHSYEKTDSANLITDSKISLALAILSFVLIGISTILGIVLTKNIFYKLKNCTEKKDGLISQVFDKHPFIFSFVIILIFWIPYIIIRYPLVTEWDAYHQILEGIGLQPINSNWPLFSTFLFGKTIQIGKEIFNDYNLAGLFLVIIQSIVCASCLAYSMVVINKFKIPKILKFGVLLFYSLATIFPRYTTAIVKDSLFSCFVVLFLTVEIDMFFYKNFSYKNIILLILSAFLMCISRSNGIFIIYFSLAYLLIYYLISKEKNLLKLFFGLIAIVLLYKGYNLALKNSGFGGSTISEALSIPFQQTARYVRNYPNEVTEEEKEQINSILDYDIIQAKYNPRLSDFVKGTYHGDNEGLKNYLFGVWLAQFFKHPLTYFSATFNNAFEFFYPFAVETESGFYKNTNNDINIKLFNEEIRNKELLENFTNGIAIIERYTLICSSSIHFWIAIYLFLYLCYKKDGRAIFILIPSLVGILVCIAGPTYTWNGIRYALPIIYSSPIILCALFFRLRDVN